MKNSEKMAEILSKQFGIKCDADDIADNWNICNICGGRISNNRCEVECPISDFWNREFFNLKDINKFIHNISTARGFDVTDNGLNNSNSVYNVKLEKYISGDLDTQTSSFNDAYYIINEISRKYKDFDPTIDIRVFNTIPSKNTSKSAIHKYIFCFYFDIRFMSENIINMERAKYEDND